MFQGCSSRVSLFQAGKLEPAQIMLAILIPFERHPMLNPSERDIGLHDAKILQRGFRDVAPAGHCCGRGQYPVGADEIASLA